MKVFDKFITTIRLAIVVMSQDISTKPILLFDKRVLQKNCFSRTDENQS